MNNKQIKQIETIKKFYPEFENRISLGAKFAVIGKKIEKDDLIIETYARQVQQHK